MTLKEYIEQLIKFASDNPGLLESTVIYFTDDEGNHFDEVQYEPYNGYIIHDEFVSIDDDWHLISVEERSEMKSVVTIN